MRWSRKQEGLGATEPLAPQLSEGSTFQYITIVQGLKSLNCKDSLYTDFGGGGGGKRYHMITAKQKQELVFSYPKYMKTLVSASVFAVYIIMPKVCSR